MANWTRLLPDDSGWYWHCDDWNSVVTLFGVYCGGVAGSFVEGPDSCRPLTKIGGWWLGPIEKPDGPPREARALVEAEYKLAEEAIAIAPRPAAELPE
jgi:hypothetical protein